MTFLSPGRLWLLALVPLCAVAYLIVQALRRNAAARYTNPALLGHVAPRRPGWHRHIGATFFLLSVVLMIVGFARPAKPVKVPRERATIIVAIDVSLSMEAIDVSPSRLDAAKAAADNFVRDLPSRFNVGLVSFSGNAAAVVAPTFDRQAVTHAINGLQLGKGTAIGEAVFIALQSIHSFDARANQDPPPSHIVLLSDGDNQTGRSVTEAAAAAHTAKVPVSTIAFGTPFGTVDIDGESVPVQVNKTTLKNLAHDTTGKAYEAQAGTQLSQVYRHIGSSLGFRIERQEAASQYILIALLFALAAAGVSLLWFQRMP